MKATASVRIPRPIEEVFAYVTDIPRMAEWVSGVRDARLLSDKVAEGARYLLVYTGMVRRPTEVEVEVVGYEPPHLFASRSTRGPVEFESRIELAEDRDDTVITSTTMATDDLATRVASWLIGWLVAKPWADRLRSELETLAADIERNASTR